MMPGQLVMFNADARTNKQIVLRKGAEQRESGTYVNTDNVLLVIFVLHNTLTDRNLDKCSDLLVLTEKGAMGWMIIDCVEEIK